MTVTLGDGITGTWSLNNSVPSMARVQDFVLGGTENFRVDRQLHRFVVALNPDFDQVVRASRRFVLQAWSRMAQDGINQFLALGSGLPTAPSLHDVVRRSRPLARVVYVEPEPIVAAHVRAVLGGRDGLRAVHHPLDDSPGILADPVVAETLDLTRPVGVHVGMLQVIRQPAAVAIMRFYLDNLVATSTLSMTAMLARPRRQMSAPRLPRPLSRFTSSIVLRSPDEAAELVDGYTVPEPGLVDLAEWAGLPAPPGAPAVPDRDGRLGCVAAVLRVPDTGGLSP